MHDSTSPRSPEFLGTGNSDDFFDLVVLNGNRLLVISTQSRDSRDALFHRFQEGESFEQACATQGGKIFSCDEIAAQKVQTLEWCDLSNVFRIEFQTSPAGKSSDLSGWLECEQVPQLLKSLESVAGPVQEIREDVVTARSLAVVIAPPVALFVGLLVWMSTGLGWIGALVAGAATCLAIGAVLWRANREPSVCHVAIFRRTG